MFIKQDYTTDYNSTSKGRSIYKQALRRNNIRASTVPSAVGYLMMAVDELKRGDKRESGAEQEVAELKARVAELELLVQKMASTKVMTNLLKPKRTKATATEDSP